MTNSENSLLIIFRHYREDLYSGRSRDPKKIRPAWYSNLLCMQSLLNSIRLQRGFSMVDLLIWYDGTQKDFDTDALIHYLKDNAGNLNISFYLKDYQGNNKSESLSFPEIVNHVLNNVNCSYIYFLENDYLHQSTAISSIFEIFQKFTDIDYLNLADHLDYYHLPVHQNYKIELRYTKNYLIKSSLTTTGTYVVKLTTFREDYPLLESDYNFFTKVVGIHNRKLFTLLPAQAAHCMSQLLPPAVSWDKVAHDTLRIFKGDIV